VHRANSNVRCLWGLLPGAISWNKPEGGLAQAQQHMELMKMAAAGS